MSKANVTKHQIEQQKTIDKLLLAQCYLNDILKSKNRLKIFEREGIDGKEHAIELHGEYSQEEAKKLLSIYQIRGWGAKGYELTKNRNLTIVFK